MNDESGEFVKGDEVTDCIIHYKEHGYSRFVNFFCDVLGNGVGSYAPNQNIPASKHPE